MNNAQIVETEFVQKDINRVVKKIGSQIRYLEISSKDYGEWDDTWLYAMGKNPDYIRKNFTASVLENLGIEFIAIFNAPGRMLWAAVYDPEEKKILPALADFSSPAFINRFTPYALSGISLIEGKPAIVAANPIKDSNGSGGPAGLLLMGSFLDKQAERLISEATEIRLKLYQPEKIESLPAEKILNPESSDGEERIIRISPSQIEGYKLLRDLAGDPALILRITQERKIYGEARSTLKYYFYNILAAWLFTSIGVQVLLIFLNRASLNRLATQELYTSVVETSPDGILLSNEFGTITFCNDRAARLLGYTEAGSIVGHSVSEFTKEADYRRLRLEVLKTRDNPLQSREFRFHRKDGGERYGEINSRVLFDSKGRFWQTVSIVRDITERKVQEEQNSALLGDISNRRAELETIIQVSSALRKAGTREEIIPIMLDQYRTLFNIEASLFIRYSSSRNAFIIEKADGLWSGTEDLFPELYAPECLSDDGNVVLFPAMDEAPGDIKKLPGTQGLSGVCFPLVTHTSSKIGRFLIGRTKAFSPPNIRLGAAISDIFANAIQRITWGDQTRERLRQLEIFHSIDLAISSTMEPSEILSLILVHVRDQLKSDGARIILYNAEEKSFSCAAASGFAECRGGRPQAELDKSLAERVVGSGEPLVLKNIPELGASHDSYSLYTKDGFISYAAFPLSAKNRILGILEVLHKSQLHFSETWVNFLKTLAGQTAIALDNAELFAGMQESNRRLSEAYEATIEGWARALDFRDHDTEGHSRRVTEVTLSLAEKIGFPERNMASLRHGALLHDIGKMGIPDSILLKPGPLEADEMAIMKTHTEIGYELISQIRFLEKATSIPLYHHEKWDGTGYPRGLAGRKIPIEARMFAIVDVWDALRSDRPYRKAWPEDRVLSHLSGLSESHFDKDIVKVFIEMQDS